MGKKKPKDKKGSSDDEEVIIFNVDTEEMVVVNPEPKDMKGSARSSHSSGKDKSSKASKTDKKSKAKDKNTSTEEKSKISEGKVEREVSMTVFEIPAKKMSDLTVLSSYQVSFKGLSDWKKKSLLICNEGLYIFYHSKYFGLSEYTVPNHISVSVLPRLCHDMSICIDIASSFQKYCLASHTNRTTYEILEQIENEMFKSSDYVKNKIFELHEGEKNKICADCRHYPSKYVAIDKGIFLCQFCSAVHRGCSQVIIKTLYENISDDKIKSFEEMNNSYHAPKESSRSPSLSEIMEIILEKYNYEKIIYDDVVPSPFSSEEFKTVFIDLIQNDEEVRRSLIA